MSNFDEKYVDGFISQYFDGDLTAILILKDYCEESPSWILNAENYQNRARHERLLLDMIAEHLDVYVDHRFAVMVTILLDLMGFSIAKLPVRSVDRLYYVQGNGRAWYFNRRNRLLDHWTYVQEVTDDPQVIHDNDAFQPLFFIYLENGDVEFEFTRYVVHSREDKTYYLYTVQGTSYIYDGVKLEQANADNVFEYPSWVYNQPQRDYFYPRRVYFDNGQWEVDLL